jgi:hypothetical protein
MTILFADIPEKVIRHITYDSYKMFGKYNCIFGLKACHSSAY